MRGIQAVDAEGFLADFKLRALWTARLVREFADEDLALRPGEGSMTTGEQIHQVCTSANFLKHVVSTGPVDASAFRREFDVSTVNKALAAISIMMDEVEAAVKAMPAEAWGESIEPFGPDWRLTRGQTAYLMLEHESHHRGQLTVYLRVAGKTPPVLYHPVDETEIFVGID